MLKNLNNAADVEQMKLFRRIYKKMGIHSVLPFWKQVWSMVWSEKCKNKTRNQAFVSLWLTEPFISYG